MTLKKATFAAGCFWGVEATFMKVKGVVQTEVGFMGGHTESPSYRDVCTDRTGHAEVVHLTYDDSIVSYDHLLDVFWGSHDPTQKNRQGPDVGTQYRTAIFYHDEEQRSTAERSRAALEASGRFQAARRHPGGEGGTVLEGGGIPPEYLQKKGLDTCHI